jgi:hypothetical protein
VSGKNMSHGLTTWAQPCGGKVAQPAHAGGTVWAHPRAVTTHPALAVMWPGRARQRLLNGEVAGVSTTKERDTCWTTIQVAELTGVANHR